MIGAYLGSCRKPETPVEKVIEQCILGKQMGDAGLTDFDPLITVMNLVADETRGLRLSLNGPKGRRTWCEAVAELQVNKSLEHNRFIPCRSCDQAFEPVIDDALLDLFLPWYWSRNVLALLAIHRCPACGGQLKAKCTKKYHGDMHTPAPGSISSDEEWARQLLQYSETYRFTNDEEDQA
jgi:hypothetical protein